MKTWILLIIALTGWACSETDGPASKRSSAKDNSGSSGASDSAEADNGSGTADDAGNTADGSGDDDANSDDETDDTTDSNGTDDAQADAGEVDGQTNDGGTQDPDTPCAGKRVGGGCWYLGNARETCTSACSSHGGYNELTNTYVGHDGTLAHCVEVVSALIAPETSSDPTDNSSNAPHYPGAGCVYNLQAQPHGTVHYIAGPTTADESTYPSMKRACACNN